MAKGTPGRIVFSFLNNPAKSVPKQNFFTGKKPELSPAPGGQKGKGGLLM
jgi:hypothetical protein